MAVSLHALGSASPAIPREESTLTERLRRFGSEEDGVDLIEYAFLVGFLAIGCYVAMTSLSTGLVGFFTSIVNSFSRILP
jgi:Flp pilus assembly pilin Flp